MSGLLPEAQHKLLEKASNGPYRPLTLEWTMVHEMLRQRPRLLGYAETSGPQAYTRIALTIEGHARLKTSGTPSAPLPSESPRDE